MSATGNNQAAVAIGILSLSTHRIPSLLERCLLPVSLMPARTQPLLSATGASGMYVKQTNSASSLAAGFPDTSGYDQGPLARNPPAKRGLNEASIFLGYR